MNIGSEIANYADDNHLYYEDKCYNVLKGVLENDVISATAFEVGLSPDQGQVSTAAGQTSMAVAIHAL